MDGVVCYSQMLLENPKMLFLKVKLYEKLQMLSFLHCVDAIVKTIGS